ncbi:MAG: hypothetical protein KAJ73_03510 [Zetaproteobacteria bacterium]|nr:hypothetical protein [Zetaproteobacteria bacterium]
MIDWKKVRTERRMKIIVVAQRDVEDYILISKLPDARTVDVYDLPEHWTISGVEYDSRRQAFLYFIISPEFETVSPGMEAETIQVKRHLMEITRKAVSA